MNSLVEYFSHVPDSHRIALLVVAIFLTWNFENILSFRLNFNKWKHAFTNASFIFVDAPVQLVLGFMFNYLLNWNQQHQVGLIHYISSKNTLLLFVVSFLFLDFFEYIYHVFMHKVRLLWYVHLVHHSDQDLDVSTTLREHPVESFIRLSFTLLWVFLTGVPFWVLMARQFIQIVSNVIAHADFRINDRLDKVLSYILVTPNMHQVHHHYELPHTDSNYGDVLSIWDRMFGTFQTMKAEDIVFGVDTVMDKAITERFGSILVLPFTVRKQYAQNEEMLIDNTELAIEN